MQNAGCTAGAKGVAVTFQPPLVPWQWDTVGPIDRTLQGQHSTLWESLAVPKK